MQKHGTIWRYLAALTVLASCSLTMFAVGGDEKKDPPKPLPEEIVKQWRGAGAESGWMKVIFDTKRRLTDFRAQEIGEPGQIPAFRFPSKAEPTLATLPDPGVAFGLELSLTRMTDAGMKDLAELKNLRL